MRTIIMILLTSVLSVQAIGANVIVVFRYDDYAAMYPGESPEQNERRMAVDRGVIEAFRRHGLQITFGVQPYAASGTRPYVTGPRTREVSTPHARASDTGAWLVPLVSDTARLNLLKEAISDGTVEVALHGFSHEDLVTDPHISEFAGLCEAVQRYRITKGKELLEEWLDCDVQSFIPPHNSYDETTLRVIADTGFQVLSADQRGTTSEPGLIYLPENTTSLEQARNAVKEVVHHKSRTVIVVMLHPFSFYGDVNGLHGLDAQLTELGSANNIEVLSLGQCAAKYGPEDITSTWLRRYYRIYALTETMARWAKSSPLGCCLVGVAAPLVLSLALAAFARALATSHRLRLTSISALWVYIGASLFTLAFLVALGHGLYHKYDSFGFKGQLFVVILLVFVLDSARRVWILRAEAHPEREQVVM